MSDPNTSGSPGDPPHGWQVQTLSANVHRLLAPNPGPLTGAGTNTYFIGDGDDVVVLDPGPAEVEHLERIALHVAGAKRVRIVATHTHRDHSPGVRPLSLALGAQTFGKSAAHMPVGSLEDHDHTFQPDVVLHDSDAIDVAGFELVAVHTPGHASNHFCFALVDSGVATHLFTGDHVMQGSTVVVAPPDGNMSDYLDSLDRLLALHARAIAPGHGAVLYDPADVLTKYKSHRLERERQVFDALGRLMQATPQDLVEVVYPELDQRLVELAQRTVWAHLRRLSETGRARLIDADNASVRAAWAIGGDSA